MLLSAIFDILIVIVAYYFALVFVSVNHEAVTEIAAFSTGYFGFSEDSTRLFIFIAFLSIVLASGLLKGLSLWLHINVSYSYSIDLAKHAYKTILSAKAETFRQYETGELIATTTTKINNLISGILIPLLNALQSGTTGIMAAIGMVLILPVEALLASLLLLLSFGLILFLFARVLSHLGVMVSSKNNKVISSLDEGLRLNHEILLSGRQEYFVDRFNKHNLLLRRASAKIKLIAGLPRYILETVFIGVGAAALFMFAGNQKEFLASIPVFATAALGAQRLMPLINLFFTSIALIKSEIPSLRDTMAVINLESHNPINHSELQTLSFTSKVSLQNICFRYNSAEPLLFENLNFSIPKGSKVALVGQTGSGKSTLAEIILGLLTPNSGSVVIDGVKLDKNNILRWYASCAYVSQNVHLLDGTIKENIIFGISNNKIDQKRLNESIDFAGLRNFLLSVPDAENHYCGQNGENLSGGQIQRIGIARAIYAEAELIVFDEATSALDGVHESLIRDAISNLPSDITVVIITHGDKLLPICDQKIELTR